MTESTKKKLNQNDFLIDIECNKKELNQKFEKLNKVFAESSERKKLLRL